MATESDPDLLKATKIRRQYLENQASYSRL